MDETSPRGTLRIQLTSEQATAVKKFIGREAAAIELTVEELEQRIVPDGLTLGETGGFGSFRLALNRNETLLV